ncbi:biliverdin-producing heme oxygenase [Acinetobacter sp. NIPH 2699]|uniref:biliverdin-producing heme oxygenase n=1 Tax=Acinetobacter sp. NIPH 2699 TaxID=2923433 RepID=UPI001F4BB54F|nr:biliverdin-producing heme oxygenase [Acinetobacter sp. NIPH 2699]MCH7336380.1 biliverdin-producing heme oxygenase [Acinetobacter sp. NIPH 2699]
MNAATEQMTINHLSQRLKQETAAEHERMHQLMAQAAVFSSKERYAQFTLSQYYFQQEIEHLFEKEGVAELIPDLGIRGRSQQAFEDLQDLGIQPSGQPLHSKNVELPEALGWIYVSEGSTLGAAFLFKEAQKNLGFSETFAARNLAAYPEGRAKVWKRFVQALDETGFDQTQQDRVIQGALDAFGYFGNALSRLDELH